MRAGLAVGDNALVVVSAKDGIEAGTEKAVKLAARKKLPTIFFINKIDEEHASFDNTYEALRERFGKAVIAQVIVQGRIVYESKHCIGHCVYVPVVDLYDVLKNFGAARLFRDD